MLTNESANGSKIGVFGGSFDPIHNGHLVAAQQVLQQLQLDTMIFVPAGNQWQKQNNATAAQRLEMTKLAVAGLANFQVSNVDVLRNGPTYTVDTISELQAQHPGAKLCFVMGTDALSGFESWRNPEEILKLAQLVVVTRPGWQLEIPEMAKAHVTVVEIEGLNLSSTDVRRNLANGTDVTGMVPAAVLRYIEEHNLYREAK